MESIAYMVLIMGIINRKFSNYILPISVGVICLVFLEVSKLVIPEYIAILLLYMIITIFIKLVADTKLPMAVFICIFVSFMLAFMQAIFTGVLGAFVEIQFMFEYGIIVMFATLISSMLIYFYVHIQIVKEALDERRELLYAVLIPSLSAVIIMHYLQLSKAGFEIASNFALIVMLLFIGVLIFDIVSKLIHKKEQHRAKKQYKEFERLVKTIGNTNDMQVIYNIALIDSIELSTYHINKYLNNFKDRSNLLHMERKALAMYLYVKGLQLKELGIELILRIESYNICYSKITDYELIQSLDILVENAKNALLKKGHKDNLEISVYIFLKELEYSDKPFPYKTIIKVVNKHEKIEDWSILPSFYEGTFTLQFMKRGRGLYRLDKLSKENNFMIFFENREIAGENHVSFSLIL